MFQNSPLNKEYPYQNQTIRLQTGLLAQQAHGSVIASVGETTVLAVAVVGKETEGDYFPLQVIYEERLYASGKIKGSRFQKREGRPSENAILTGRMVDRSIRSLFNQNLRQELQVVITVLSIDEVNPPDTISVLAASLAIQLAGITDFQGSVSSVRVGLKNSDVGQTLVERVSTALESAQSFQDLRPVLSEVSQILDESIAQENEYLKQIFSLVGRANPEWAAKFRLIYKTSPKMNLDQINEKFNLQPNFIFNPSYLQQDDSILDLVVSGDGDNIVMVEAGANIVPEEILNQGLDQAMPELQQLCQIQSDFLDHAQSLGLIQTRELNAIKINPRIKDYWRSFEKELDQLLYSTSSKTERNQALNDYTEKHLSLAKQIREVCAKENFNSIEQFKVFLTQNPIQSEIEPSKLIDSLDSLDQVYSLDKELALGQKEFIHELVKTNILKLEKRLDGRDLNQTRQITCQVGVLPHTHGSSLFQRGETQVLNVLTLGTMRDAQTLDDMEDFEETSKRYIHHYNFPPYSVGEVGRYIGPGRREIGHGALAEKALLPVLPNEEKFPYTMRLVSECLGSNGSTSMASTCASCLSLLDGGVQIKDLVAGVAMGLVLDQTTSEFKVLTDILGAEDHFGDMDFKVTGTKDGVTAIQLDNKVAGLTATILKTALLQAREARLHILGIMRSAIDSPRTEISKYAPRVTTLSIPVDKIGEVIGPSGKMIKSIIQKFDVEVDIEDNTGKTFIYAKNPDSASAAAQFISDLIREYKAGDVVQAEIFRIESYGAFAKINGTDKEGLIHISQLSAKRVGKVEDVVQIGQQVQAKILEVNEKGQLSLSLK